MQVYALNGLGPSVRLSRRFFAITAGCRQYGQIQTITEPNDGVWRLYTYDPSASEVTHVKARLSIASEQDFGADSLYLDSPYGGP